MDYHNYYAVEMSITMDNSPLCSRTTSIEGQYSPLLSYTVKYSKMLSTSLITVQPMLDSVNK